MRRLNLAATLTQFSNHPGLRIYRGTKVKFDGSVSIDGRVELGSQWPGNPFYHPGYLVVGPGASFKIRGDLQILTGLQIILDQGAKLVIGSGYINTDVRISCFSSISIGDDVAIAPGVSIRDSDNHRVGSLQQIPAAPITIGDHVWIGLGATILKGVNIGNGAIVGAGALVNRDVPPHTISVGVPARVVRTDVTWT